MQSGEERQTLPLYQGNCLIAMGRQFSATAARTLGSVRQHQMGLLLDPCRVFLMAA
jgi:hypothetical protein